jgi:hypothetical protein
MSRTDAVWSEQGTTPDAIEGALRKLLIDAHAEHDDYVPARVLNMIAFVDREWTVEIANRLRAWAATTPRAWWCWPTSPSASGSTRG